MCIAAQPHTSALLLVLYTKNQSLARHNRKPMQVIENKHQHYESIASFCRVFSDCQAKGAQPRKTTWGIVAVRNFAHPTFHGTRTIYVERSAKAGEHRAR